MSKSHTFSIYLLKHGFSVENALKEDHLLEGPISAEKLPIGAKLFVMDKKPMPPWWKSYWGINQYLEQVLKGAIVFLPIEDRYFALTFGHTYHQLKPESYEYDFGLIVTLNALDPDKIKSTDIFQPEKAIRERIQSPIASNITFFDINKDETIIKRLTGFVKNEYQSFLSNITGSSSLHITSKVESSQISELCKKLLEIYNKNDYKTSFPDIRNIVPVKDPILISKLNNSLMSEFNDRSNDLALSIPDIIEYSESLSITYEGAGKSEMSFNDAHIENYRFYLDEKSIDHVDLQDFKNHKLNMIDENENMKKSFSIYKCLIFDCELDGYHYHLCEGEWYRVEKDYLKKLRHTLDPVFVDFELLDACDQQREDDYNRSIASKNGATVVCLDKSNIAMSGNIEPCDLFVLEDGKALLIHIKISTISSMLSHLFNQGLNSIQLLRTDNDCKEKLKSLLINDAFKNAINNEIFEVIYAIITPKDKNKKSMNLPIFSRISLMRTINTLRLMKVGCRVVLVKDLIDRKNKR